MYKWLEIGGLEWGAFVLGFRFMIWVEFVLGFRFLLWVVVVWDFI